MVAVLKLAQIGRELVRAPEVVILAQDTSGRQGGTIHSWTVDTSLDEEPRVAELLGQRVVIVAVEQVLRGNKRGEWLPKGPGDFRLMSGVRPPRGWVSLGEL